MFVVNLFLYFQLIVSFSSKNNYENKNKKIYIYDWPEYLIDLWPNLTESTRDMKLTSKLNYGVGSLLNETIGMFDTFQFGLIFFFLFFFFFLF